MVPGYRAVPELSTTYGVGCTPNLTRSTCGDEQHPTLVNRVVGLLLGPWLLFHAHNGIRMGPLPRMEKTVCMVAALSATGRVGGIGGRGKL